MVGFENGQHVFRFRCDGTTGLYLAGDFNEWSTSATPLQQVKPGTWETKLKLPEGEHRYRYVTAEGGWQTDFSAPNVVANPYGGWDSVVIVSKRRKSRLHDLIEIPVKKSAPEPPVVRTARSRVGHRRSKVSVLPPLKLTRA